MMKMSALFKDMLKEDILKYIEWLRIRSTQDSNEAFKRREEGNEAYYIGYYQGCSNAFVAAEVNLKYLLEKYL